MDKKDAQQILNKFNSQDVDMDQDQQIIKTDKSLVEVTRKKIITADGRQLLI